MPDDAPWPKASGRLSRRRRDLAPEAADAFPNLSQAVFRERALSRKHKQIIAVAAAHVTQLARGSRGSPSVARSSSSGRQVVDGPAVVASAHRGVEGVGGLLCAREQVHDPEAV